MKKPSKLIKTRGRGQGRFHIEFKNDAQKEAWAAFQEHDVLFLNGPAGTGKSFLATAFAISEILNANRKKIVLTRPIVEAGPSLGYLPGDFMEKVGPYMTPLYDSIEKLVGTDNPQRDMINAAIEVAPLAFMRGRTLDDAICIFDEAQNASFMEIKLFLTRMGENSKLIINGDPSQSDLNGDYVALLDVMDSLKRVPGIKVLEFKADSIVRHPLISKMLDALAE